MLTAYPVFLTSTQENIAKSRKAYGAWSIDMCREDSRKDSFMLHATYVHTTISQSFSVQRAAVKQVF
jgi:hypothetical protein